jgi:hypothetical protein
MGQPLTKEGWYHIEHFALMYCDLLRAMGCTDIKWEAGLPDDNGDVKIDWKWTPPNIVYVQPSNVNDSKPFPMFWEHEDEQQTATGSAFPTTGLFQEGEEPDEKTRSAAQRIIEALCRREDPSLQRTPPERPDLDVAGYPEDPPGS